MTEITCKSCDYTWDYGGDLMLATCPSCNIKNEVPQDDPEEVESHV